MWKVKAWEQGYGKCTCCVPCSKFIAVVEKHCILLQTDF